MIDTRYGIFPTPIGACAIAWGASGIRAVFLPEDNDAIMRGRVQRRCPGAAEAEPDAEVGAVMAGIEALLSGESVSFDHVQLDGVATPEFDRRVYELTRAIRVGETLTYGDVARIVGTVADSRRVGQALGRNPWPIIVPCHRILAASGRTGGFSAPGGIETKLRILSIEARHASAPPGLFGELPLAARPPRDT